MDIGCIFVISYLASEKKTCSQPVFRINLNDDMDKPVKLLNCIAWIICAICLMETYPVAAHNPVARKEAIVNSGNVRFTVLTPEMIRIEHSDLDRKSVV